MIDPIKVLHVAPLPPPLGGMTSYIQGLLNSDVFRTIDYRVVRFSYFNKEKYLGITRFLANCLNAVVLTINFLINLIFWHPTIVHIQSNSGFGFFEKSWIAFLAKVFRRKTIFHFHGGYMREWYEQLPRFAQFLIRQCALINDRIMTGSPQMRETWLYIGVPEEKIIYIGNAVNLPAQDGIDRSFRDSISLLFLTRVVLEKGIIELIDAYLLLQKEIANLKLRIVGADTLDTPYVKKYLQNVDKNNLVEYIGPVNDQQKHKEYLESDIFVFPTYVEDQSYAVMEAMSYGLPVIASNVGGVPSLIAHEQNGYLVIPKNVDSLREGIRRVISEPNFRKTLGENARKTIEQGFTWNVRSKEIVTLYQTLVKSK
ncbi:MAG: hypothetical protein CVU44_14485 [Chloroflexi bacterium HGW-Chloroflexi-6]|nr:MAG: hypothetical protein CVU44_14485 [Chloroflexi bacterium HGW-Chloroflexi-6]